MLTLAPCSLLVALAGLALAHHPGSAQPAPRLTPEAALERLFTSEPVRAEWFTSAFLAQVPLTQLEMLLGQLKQGAGQFRSVRPTDSGYEVLFERGTLPVNALVLDEAGRFAGLLFGFFQPSDPVTARREALETIAALPEEKSVLVLRNGQDEIAVNPDAPLAVGSTFKLAVLAALRAQVDAGQRRWSDVVTLRPEWKSLPSGQLQDWPEGAPLTLDTLASLMISVSDNTATDALIALVGREAIEPLIGRNVPLLTTRELFVLKADADLRARYLAADEAGRRAVLAEADARPLPRVSEVVVNTPGAEWYFTTRELCALIARVADLPQMGINPGMAQRGDWARIAFKGGSDTGVINLTHALTGVDGVSTCVSVTWNTDTTLDEQEFVSPVGQLIAALR